MAFGYDKFGWNEEARHVYYTASSQIFEAPGLEEKLLREKANLQAQIANLQRELHETHMDSLRATNRALIAEAKLRIIEREGL